jgi:hypothetical protein
MRGSLLIQRINTLHIDEIKAIASHTVVLHSAIALLQGVAQRKAGLLNFKLKVCSCHCPFS